MAKGHRGSSAPAVPALGDPGDHDACRGGRSSRNSAPVAGLQCQRRRDVGHRDVVLAFVILDQPSEHVEARAPRASVIESRNLATRWALTSSTVGRGDLLDRLASDLLNRLEQVALPRRYEQQGSPRSPSTAGAADPVHVGLRVVRDVVVQHVRNTFHVEASSGDVGGHQNVDTAVFERSDSPFTLGLGDIAVDCGGGNPRARSFSATSSVACLVLTKMIIASKGSTSNTWSARPSFGDRQPGCSAG